MTLEERELMVAIFAACLAPRLSPGVHLPTCIHIALGDATQAIDMIHRMVGPEYNDKDLQKMLISDKLPPPSIQPVDIDDVMSAMLMVENAAETRSGVVRSCNILREKITAVLNQVRAASSYIEAKDTLIGQLQAEIADLSIDLRGRIKEISRLRDLASCADRNPDPATEPTP